MTKTEIIEVIEKTLAEKMKKNENYIRYSYYEVNVKHTKNEKDKNLFMELLINKLENNNYHVYREGQRFNYNGASILVQINEELIAIKNKKEDVNNGIIQRRSSKKIRKVWSKGRSK